MFSNSHNKSSSSSSSSEGLYDIDDDENEMDCELNNHHAQQRQPLIRPSLPFYRAPYHHQGPPPYYCNTSPLLAQRLAIPTTTAPYTP
jgi:hypothetical protein